MPLNFIFLFLTVVLILFLGIAVYIKAPKNKSTILFLFLTIFASLWGITLLIYGFVESISLSIELSKASHFMAAIASLVLLDFSIFFNRNERKFGIFLKLLHVFALIFLFAAMVNGLLIKDILRKEEIITSGPLYPFYAALIIGLLGSSIVILFRRYLLEKEKIRRIQLKYLFLGISTTAILAMGTNLFPEILFGRIEYYWLGPTFLLFLIIAASIAILRYHLFNIKVITTELLIFSVWCFLLIRLFLVEGITDFIINGTLLLMVVIFGFFLIKSVLLEVRQREELEKVSNKLNDLKVNLEIRVEEQTVEIKKAYEIEKKARIELEELDKTKDQFILTTQHHLRTPLTIIKGYLDLLENEFALPTDAKSTVINMLKSVEMLYQSVNKLLDATELEVMGRINK